MTPQTPAEKIAALEARVTFLEISIPQILQHVAKANDFFSRHEQKEETLEQIQEQRHLENQQKIDAVNTKLASRSFWVNLAALSVTVAMFVLTALGIIISIKLANHSLNDVIHIFISHQPVSEAMNSARY